MAGKVSSVVAFVALSCSLLTGCVRESGAPARAPGPAACTNDTLESKAGWDRFRALHPLHIQGVALSPTFGEGCRTLVIAEPPPRITLKNIVDIAPELLTHNRVEQHGVGYDGWTKDVVITLPPVEAAQLSELVSALHERLFDTTYKSYVLDIPAKVGSAQAKTVDLDLRVTHEELRNWSSSGELYKAVEGGEAVTLDDLLVLPQPGVYLSASPGLVAWALPRHGRFDQNLVEARQFVLDSDLVIGAVASDETVLIFGRERIAPVDVLPPLRVETLLLLASVDQGSLWQSFNLRHIFAGRQEDQWDLRVIGLSDELFDSEYGSLLNITDQFLKSWSENGEVRYFNFPQPDPPRWGFDEPISRKLGSRGLTYNWNTRGFGATVDLGSHELLAFRGTASLPVSYIPEVPRAGMDRYEERGYEFFASQSDPNLVRVAQYTALFQTFQAFGIRAGQKPAKAPRVAQEAILEHATKTTLEAIRDATPQQLDEAVAKDVAFTSSSWGWEPADALTQANSRSQLNAMQRFLKGATSDDLSQIATQLALPDSKRNEGMTKELVLWTQWFQDNRWVFRSFTDIPAIKAAYVKTSQPLEGTWIHTPSLALSKRARDWTAYSGGHNIDAQVASISVDPYYRGDPVLLPGPRGQKIGFGHINPRDLGKIRLDPSADPSAPARTTTLALKRPLHEDGIVRGAPRSNNNGWETETLADAERPRALADTEAVILVSRTKDGYQITSSEGHILRAKTPTDARDAALRITRRATRNNQDARVILNGFANADEARGFSNGLKLRSKSDEIMVANGNKSAAKWSGDKYHFKDTEVTEAASAQGGAELKFIVNSKAGKSTPFTLKAWIKNTKAMPTKVFATVKELFKRVIKRLGQKRHGATVNDVAKAMRKELKDHVSEVGDVEFEIINELGDSLFVRIDVPIDPPGQKKAKDG